MRGTAFVSGVGWSAGGGGSHWRVKLKWGINFSDDNGTVCMMQTLVNTLQKRYPDHQLPRGTMNIPEYLDLFSNQGTIDVHVSFEDHAGSIPSKKMGPKEIAALILPDSKGFHTQMTFDDWLFVITKYQLEPAENKLTIFARKSL